jgi:hypothetical protein
MANIKYVFWGWKIFADTFRKYFPTPGKIFVFTSLFVHVDIIIGTKELSMMRRGGNSLWYIAILPVYCYNGWHNIIGL